VNLENPRSSRASVGPALLITGSFVGVVPLSTFALLAAKGFPSFVTGHLWEVILWVYAVSWIPALCCGAVTSVVVLVLAARTTFFHRPYDVGRCVSLGAITGTLTEGLATWLYREASQRPFSWFWIAAAMIAGCLCGGLVVSWVLWRLSRKSAPL
jgi:hypothetical protein